MIQASIKSLEKYWVFMNKPGLGHEPICNHSWWPFSSYSKTVAWRPTQRIDPRSITAWFQLFCHLREVVETREYSLSVPQGKFSEDRAETLIAFYAFQYPARSQVELKEWMNGWVNATRCSDKTVASGNLEGAILATCHAGCLVLLPTQERKLWWDQKETPMEP